MYTIIVLHDHWTHLLEYSAECFVMVQRRNGWLDGFPQLEKWLAVLRILSQLSRVSYPPTYVVVYCIIFVLFIGYRPQLSIGTSNEQLVFLSLAGLKRTSFRGGVGTHILRFLPNFKTVFIVMTRLALIIALSQRSLRILAAIPGLVEDLPLDTSMGI